VLYCGYRERLSGVVMSREEHEETPFRPIVGWRVSDEVVDQIMDAVHTGLYEVGTRLPRMDELAEAMQVSKPTVGEALRVLTRAGVLTVKRGAGGGAVVASTVIPLEILRRSRAIAGSLREVVEARRPVEVELARLAAVKANERDLLELREAIRLGEEARGDISKWTSSNFKFHYTIGRAADSRMLFHFQTELNKELAVFLEEMTPRDLEDPKGTLAEHREILAAIESRDPDRAAEAVGNHMLEIEAMVSPMGELDATPGSR
jgi:GntR family transcriptional regulator, transcriptional repressor for pyruvate dehydrogenase complex